jgi:glutamyl-tRNA synthetase
MSIFSSRKRVVTRMAPSPTGHLHIGTARTALFNYLYAKRHGGVFILRIEDTDKERSKKEYEDEIIEGLHWLEITWDALYRQSERSAIYRGYLEKAIANGTAYISKEESKSKPGESAEVVRLKNPNTAITFIDEIRGEITFDTTELGDFVIARSLDDALYHFTVVVDDHEMEVTHVIRGEDHISNTPRQILIQQAIGAEQPVYAHLPLILAPDRSKLSKRHGSVMLREYEKQGFLKEAINNYLALLGWNSGTDQEIYSLEELTRIFNIGGIQKGGAIFNVEKLKWFNKEYLKKLPEEIFFKYASARLPQEVKNLPQYSEGRFAKLIPVIRERVSTGAEISNEFLKGEYDFAFEAPHVNPHMIKWKADSTPRESLPRLQKVAEMLARLPEESGIEEIRNFIWPYAEEVGRGEVLWPLRVSLSGKEKSPDPFTIIHIIGSGEAYKRIIAACDTILRAPINA